MVTRTAGVSVSGPPLKQKPQHQHQHQTRQPLAAFFGGVVAQEVVKFTGKYQPLKQWLHLDAFEALPSERPTPQDTAPRNSRYDDLIAMYGAKFVGEKLGNARTFVVGCGALGCEYLKNFALLGVGTGPEGRIVVTDNDRIEVSNLNRQVCYVGYMGFG